MPKMRVNDINMYYEVEGEGEPIVLIGGFSTDHTIWLETANYLKLKHQVILFDNRGAGQTDVPEGPYSIDQMAEDTAALCQAIGIKKAHFVGNSMGGYITQCLAYQYPDIVKSAVISNSVMRTDCPFHLYVDAQLQLRKANAPLVPLIQGSCSWVFSYRFLSLPGVLEQLIQYGLNNPYPFTNQGYAGQYAALDQFDSSQWVSNIRVPVLVIGSDEDLVFNERSVRALAEAIPNARYYGFQRCGHLPSMEFPEEFASVVGDFIANVTSSGKLE